ncbi:MAG: restriction endonuclease subunit S [Alistipes onderdonkii]
MDTKKLRQKILDLAIHGKLVPQDPTDEPASVLLERIKAEKERLIKEGKIKRSKKSAKTSDTPHYENVPFEVPEGWVWCRLGDVISIKSGDSIRVRDNRQGEYPIYGGNGINGYYSDCNVKPDTIVIGRVGFYCGSIHQTVSKAWVTDNAFIVSYESVFNSEYLCHLLEWLQLSKTSNSTAQPVISGKGIYPLLIPLPPLSEQERIVSEVKRCFTLIDIIENGKSDLQTTIKQTKSKILDLAIHGKLVPQDPNDEPAIELLKRINPDFTPCDNGHYPQLPDGWCYSTIKEVFIINPRNKVDDDVEVGFVPMANITDGYNNTFKYEKKRWGKIKTGFTHFADGDIAVAKISPCLENRKSVVLKGLPNGIGAGTTELHVFRSQFIDTQYGLYFFKSDYFISQCIGSFNGVVGQQRVSKNIIEDIIIAIPPINEQKRIVYTVRKIFAQLDIIMGSL